MTSILLNLYADLEGMAVSYQNAQRGTITPRVIGLDEIPNSVQTGHLPCRILMPQGYPNPVTMEIQQSNGANARWIINDVFLLDTVTQGQGLRTFSEQTTRYIAAYAEAIAHLWRYPAYGEALLEQSVTFSAGEIEYPPQSGVFFFGVRATITLDEYVI